MNTYNVGDACFAYGMYGRIVELDGGMFYFSSPHGTVIKVGFAWFAKDARHLESEEDFQRLNEFEGKALAAGKPLYNGRIMVDEPSYLDLIH